MTFPDLVGLLGVGLYVLAYAGLQIGRLSLADHRHTWLNLLGGVLIIYSLLYRFNVASMASQLLWMLFTVVGYARMRRRRRRR